MNITEPKFWWNFKPSLQMKLISFPFGLILKILIFFRYKFFKKTHLIKPVICVGNLTVGGSGKTPTVIYISNLLKKLNINTVVLLKGYKGKLNGPIKIVSDYNSIDVGDEAILHSKINETWISNNRYLMLDI